MFRIHTPALFAVKIQKSLGFSVLIKSRQTTYSTFKKMNPFNYPEVRRDDSVVETLHGQKVADPYRFLEDPASEETKRFVVEQNKLFDGFISKYAHRQQLKDKITAMFNYERFGCPIKRGDFFYYFHNSGLQAQSVMYRQSSLDASPTVFFDPNKLSEDGTVSLNTYAFSKSGKYFAYAISTSGSDWVVIKVKETTEAVASDIEERGIEWAKFTSIQWAGDDSGFFYQRYAPPSQNLEAGTEVDSNKFAKIYFHKLGTDQSEDVVIYEDKGNPDYTYGLKVTQDSNYFVLSVNESCAPVNKVYIALMDDIQNGNFNFKRIVDDFAAEYSYIDNDGSHFYFQTTLNAPNGKIVHCDISTAIVFRDVVEECSQVLEFNAIVNQDVLVLVYSHDVKASSVPEHSARLSQPMPNPPPLPEGSIVQQLSCRKEDSFFFYHYSSFISPGTICHHDFSTGQTLAFRQVHVEGHCPDHFCVEQEFITSKDGTRVPIFILSLKDHVHHAETPALMYGYGGFNISVTPSFSATWLTFVRQFKGIVVIANIRGGNEYGIAWNEAGKLLRKQNVFDDFQSAALHLIDKGYTRPTRLAINGGSNGGLLVAACANQTPHLFGCCVADVGVMDMIRFPLFTIGIAWTSDYGNPVNSKEDLENVLRYSPLHNVKPSTAYPAYLLTTSDHDDRVVPLHSYKLAAQLQHVARNNPNPLFIRIVTNAGHGAGKSTQQRIDEAADKFSFIAMSLDAPYFD